MAYSFKDYLINEDNLAAMFEDVFQVANNLHLILSNYLASSNKNPKSFLSAAENSVKTFCVLKAFSKVYNQILPNEAPVGSSMFYKLNARDLVANLLKTYNFDSNSHTDDEQSKPMRAVLNDAKYFYKSFIKALETNDIVSIKEFLDDIADIEKYFKSISHAQQKLAKVANEQ